MQDKKSKVLFVCDRFPMLQMVIERDRVAIIGGEVIRTPHQTIGFKKTPYGGQYETSEPDIIEFIRDSQQFQSGEIVEVSDINKLRGNKEVVQQVVTGMVTSAPRQEPTVAPEPATPVEPVVVAAKGPGAALVPARAPVF